ncbi:hypothetical protein TL16_g12417, partial [Triparma laevis f. inornata]
MANAKAKIHDLIQMLPEKDRAQWNVKNDLCTSARQLSTFSSDLKDTLGITKEKKSVFNDLVSEITASSLNPDKLELGSLAASILSDPLRGVPASPSMLSHHIVPNLLTKEIVKNPTTVGLDLDAVYQDAGLLNITGKPPPGHLPLPDKQSSKLYNNFKNNLESVLALDGKPLRYLQPHTILKVERLLKEHAELQEKMKKQQAKEKSKTKVDVGALKVEVVVNPGALQKAVFTALENVRVGNDAKSVFKKALFMALTPGANVSNNVVPDNAKVAKLYEVVKRSAVSKHKTYGNHAWHFFYEKALEHSGKVFCSNVSSRLGGANSEAGPFTEKIIGIDPGIASGFKLCILKTMKDTSYLETINLKSLKNGLGVIDYKGSKNKAAEQVKAIFSETGLDNIDVVVGEGTGCEEVIKFVEGCLPPKTVNWKRISEDGASVYSTTDAAMEEYKKSNPGAGDVHPSWLGALSICRRYVSPLSELIKIPPQNLGLGLYQHDSKDGVLKVNLDRVVVDTVAERGVYVNYEPESLLKYIPGFSKKILQAVLDARPFETRKDMMKMTKGMGPKTYENCVAFCMIDGKESLDSTRVHPEDYKIAQAVKKAQKSDAEIAEKYSVDISKINEVKALLQPKITKNQGEECISSSQGIELPAKYRDKKKLSSLPTTLLGIRGKVSNMVDFGCFVDFGISGVSGLLHRSQLGRDGFEGLTVGGVVVVDVVSVDAERGRVGLRRNYGESQGGKNSNNYNNGKRSNEERADNGGGAKKKIK